MKNKTYTCQLNLLAPKRLIQQYFIVVTFIFYCGLYSLNTLETLQHLPLICWFVASLGIPVILAYGYNKTLNQYPCILAFNNNQWYYNNQPICVLSCLFLGNYLMLVTIKAKQKTVTLIINQHSTNEKQLHQLRVLMVIKRTSPAPSGT